MAYINGNEILFSADVGLNTKKETWALTLADGSTVTKEVYVTDD